MAYMKVLSKTESQLQLLREPAFLSKAIFAGFLVGVFGVFMYGSESCLLKVVIGLCMLILSSVLIDNYEVCEIDKDLAVVKLSKLHWCQYLLESCGLFSNHPHVTFKIEDIQDVTVQEQLGSSTGKFYQVAFVLDSGLKVGATQVFTTACRSDHEETAAVIRSFLNIPKSQSQNENEYEGDGSSSSDDDGFEQISSDDVRDLEAELSKASQGAESIGDVLPNTNDASAAAAACAVDDHGDNAHQGLGENAASS